MAISSGKFLESQGLVLLYMLKQLQTIGTSEQVDLSGLISVSCRAQSQLYNAVSFA